MKTYTIIQAFEGEKSLGYTTKVFSDNELIDRHHSDNIFVTEKWLQLTHPTAKPRA